MKVYTANGARFIQVLNFSKHQNPHVKEQESTIPAPDLPGASPVQEQDQPQSEPEQASEIPERARLIPSSLIPDSLNPHPDSLIPDSGSPSTATDLAQASPGRPRKTVAISDSAETWAAYAEGYRQRYGTDPVRNAMVNGQLAQFVKRVGAVEAPDIARFYVGLSTAWYVTKGHPVGLLLNDAEKLRTEWATGKTINGTAARRQEATAANPFVALLQEGTHG